MIDDLDRVAVRVIKVKRPSPIPMGLRTALQAHATAIKIPGPAVYVVRTPHEQAEVIKRRVPLGPRPRRAVKGKIVGARRQVGVVVVGLPLNPKPEHIDIEPLGFIERAHVQRQVTKTELRRSVGHNPML